MGIDVVLLAAGELEIFVRHTALDLYYCQFMTTTFMTLAAKTREQAELTGKFCSPGSNAEALIDAPVVVGQQQRRRSSIWSGSSSSSGGGTSRGSRIFNNVKDIFRGKSTPKLTEKGGEDGS